MSERKVRVDMEFCKGVCYACKCSSVLVCEENVWVSAYRCTNVCDCVCMCVGVSV